MTSNRDQALEQVKTLISDNNLSKEDILSLFSAEKLMQETSNLLQRILIYLGGVFVFAGIAVYASMVWDDLGSLSRVILTLGSGFVAFMLGLFTMGDQRFIKAATPMFLIAAALEPSGLFIFMDEYLPKSGDMALASMVVFAFMAVQMAVAYFASDKTSLLFFTTFFFFAFLYALLSWMDIGSPESAMTLGLGGLITSWSINRTKHSTIAAFFFFWSSTLTAAAAFDICKYSGLDALLIGVSGFLIYLSTLAASRTLLVVGVVSLLAYIGYFTDQYFADLLSWPIALVVMGLLMLGISAFAVKLGKKIAKNEA